MIFLYALAFPGLAQYNLAMVRIGLPEIIIILIAMVVVFRFDVVAGRTRALINAIKNLLRKSQNDPDKPDRKTSDGPSSPDQKNNPRV